MLAATAIKTSNIKKVKKHFLTHMTGTRNELSDETDLSRATITTILQELVEQNYILRTDDLKSNGGRNIQCYTLNKEYRYFTKIALKLNKDKVTVSMQVVNLVNEVVFGMQKVYDKYDISVLLSDVLSLKSQHSFDAIIISLPGIIIDNKLSLSDIETIQNTDIEMVLQASIQVPVILANDVNSAILGYVKENNLENSTVAFLYQPDNSYSGLALYANGGLLSGYSNFAGELRYLPGTSSSIEENHMPPETVLLRQVASVISIINPEKFVILSPYLKKRTFCKNIEDMIPCQHLPHFEYIIAMENYSLLGMYSLYIENIND